MLVVFWAIVTVVSASFGVTTGFLVVASARRIEASGIKLHGWRRVIVRFWLLVGGVSDAVYNHSIGAWRFKELWPDETMYSHTVQRLVDGQPSKYRDKAIEEARFLNAAWGEPPHIERVPE